MAFPVASLVAFPVEAGRSVAVLRVAARSEVRPPAVARSVTSPLPLFLRMAACSGAVVPAVPVALTAAAVRSGMDLLATLTPVVTRPGPAVRARARVALVP